MEAKKHICPVWVGYLMASPLRKLQQNPYRMLKPYIQPGYKVLEIGPAMGFFSLPMASMVQPNGVVYCVDIQHNMLTRLARRAESKKLDSNIELVLADKNSQNISHLSYQIDFCLLAFVMHEVPNQEKLFAEIFETLKDGAKVLFMEPKGHVKQAMWKQSLGIAAQCGFTLVEQPVMRGTRVCELIK